MSVAPGAVEAAPALTTAAETQAAALQSGIVPEAAAGVAPAAEITGAGAGLTDSGIAGLTNTEVMAANPSLYPTGSVAPNMATTFTPSAAGAPSTVTAATGAAPTVTAAASPAVGSNVAAPATTPMSSFDAAMKDPAKYIDNNRLRMFSAGLAGATGARKKNEVPIEKEYNGPLKRFNPFDPNKYQASRYAEGGITNLASGGYDQQVGEDPYPYPQSMASGGIANLGGYSDGGRMLKGPGDGMSDSIPANISGKLPSRLADGEFVVPADVVSHLGNGSTDAGAKTLYSMMDKVRTARTGRKSQGKQINAGRYMPT
jgi:hypothetical protein